MLDITTTITAAYAFVWRERLNFARLTLFAVIGLTFLSVTMLSLGIAKEDGKAIIDIFVLLLAAQFMVAWHRHYLMPAEPVKLRGTYRFGRRQGRYLLMGLGIGLLLSPISIGAGYFSFYVAGVFVDPQSSWFQSVAGLIALPLLLPAVLVFARFSLWFPAAAVDRHLSLRTCWQLTAGYGWQLFFLVLLAWGPAGLFSIFAALVSGALSRVGDPSGPALLGHLFTFIGHGLFFIGTALLASVLSIAYRTLTPEPAPVPSVPPAPPPQKREGIGKWAWLGNAFVAGLVLGGAVFIAGFFGPLILGSDSNQAPLAGFLYAPIGFIAGFLLGLLWNARKLKSRLAAMATIFGVLLLGGAALMSPFPGFILRAQLAEVLPASMKRLVAPQGVLQIWAFGVPPEERPRFLDHRMPTYVGGPITGLWGAYEVSFHDAEELPQAFMQARKQGRGPDVLAGKGYAPIEAIFRSADLRARMPEVVGHFSYRSMGPVAIVDRDSPNFDLARKLALHDVWCDERALAEATSLYLEVQLKELAVELAKIAIAGDVEKLRPHDSKWRMGLNHAASNTSGSARIESAKFCGAWGSPTLAFAEVIVNFEAQRVLGQTTLALAFHREPQGWRLLAISPERASLDSIRGVASQLEQALLSKQGDPDVPEAAVPQEPYEYVPAPDSKQREGYLVWSPSASRNVVAEIAEIACRSRDHDNIEHDDVQLVVRLRERRGKSAHSVHARNACPSGWPWKWRIWSVTGGGIHFSGEQPIPN